MNQEKLQFLKTEFIPLLQKLQPDQKGNWGKMDARQMVEHFIEAARVANGKTHIPLHTTDPGKLEKFRGFLMSDIPFKENTRSPVLGVEPEPYKYESLPEAIEILERELQAVFAAYENDSFKTILNPSFGQLNYEQQVQLLHKHAVHHLKQFRLM
jgi:hypothetical protein